MATNSELVLPDDTPILEKDVPLGQMYIDGSGRLCMAVCGDDSGVVIFPEDEACFFHGRRTVATPIKMLVRRVRIEIA